MSTFMAKMLLTVSTRVSPFFTDDPAAEKFTTSADSRFSANSKDSRVRVEFSKKRLATVKSRSEGTFLIGRFRTSLNSLAVLWIKSKSADVKPRMPSRLRCESVLEALMLASNSIE